METITVYQDGKRFVARCTYEQKDIVKMAGFRWDRDNRHWYTTEPAVAAKFASPEAQRGLFEAQERERTRRAENVEASRLADADIEIPCPEGLAYLPYQKAGIAFALRKFGFDFTQLEKNAKGSLSKDSESTCGVSGESGEGPRAKGASQGGGIPAGDRQESGVAQARVGSHYGSLQATGNQESPPGSDLRATSEFQGRQRPADNAGSCGSGGDIGAAGVHPGTGDQNEGTRNHGEPATRLQGGLRESGDKDGYRAGRTIASQPQATSAGSQERQSTIRAGLENNTSPALVKGGTTSISSVGVLFGDEMG